jgi:hypothetical protein
MVRNGAHRLLRATVLSDLSGGWAKTKNFGVVPFQGALLCIGGDSDSIGGGGRSPPEERRQQSAASHMRLINSPGTHLI